MVRFVWPRLLSSCLYLPGRHRDSILVNFVKLVCTRATCSLFVAAEAIPFASARSDSKWSTTASIACSAAAFQGKSVLLLDSSKVYGGFGATVSLSTFAEWYAHHAAAEEARASDAQGAAPGCMRTAPDLSAGARSDDAVPSSSGLAGPPASSKSAYAHDDAVLPSPRHATEVEIALPQRDDHIQHIEATVHSSRVPGRDNEYSIDLAHQVCVNAQGIYLNVQSVYGPGGSCRGQTHSDSTANLYDVDVQALRSRLCIENVKLLWRLS